MPLRRYLARLKNLGALCLFALLTACASIGQAPEDDSGPALRSTSRPFGSQARTALSPTILPVVEVSVPLQALETVDLTYEVDDLFERMRNGFSMPDINSDLVLSHQQWYLNRPDSLRRLVERSSRYMHYIVEELDKRGMPMELALLPMVESAYNPMAYSPAKASGLWQFIPSTGKHFNLNQNWWVDERRDIIASTSAALDYLQMIYEMHGDWHLALASYNWGEGSVARAINKNKALGLPTDYLSLTMPNETKNYVPKLQALKNIFGNTALFAQLDLKQIPNRPYFKTFSRPVTIDVKLAAQLAEMPVQDFVALNPASNRPVIRSETTVVLPADKVETFNANLEAHENSNKPLSSWQNYTMQPGDKLEKIAPRFGMTVAALRAANGLNGKSKPTVGQTLLVAGAGQADAENLATLQEQPKSPAVEAKTASASVNTTPATASTNRSHTVRKGETLATLAKRYDMTPRELKRINRLKSDKITPGTRLALAAETKVAQETAAKKDKQDKTPVKQAAAQKDKAPVKQAVVKKDKLPKVTRYIVQKGDTLSSIAKQFKVAKDDLMRWNKISASALKPGKSLTIQLAQSS